MDEFKSHSYCGLSERIQFSREREICARVFNRRGRKGSGGKKAAAQVVHLLEVVINTTFGRDITPIPVFLWLQFRRMEVNPLWPGLGSMNAFL